MWHIVSTTTRLQSFKILTIGMSLPLQVRRLAPQSTSQIERSSTERLILYHVITALQRQQLKTAVSLPPPPPMAVSLSETYLSSCIGFRSEPFRAIISEKVWLARICMQDGKTFPVD